MKSKGKIVGFLIFIVSICVLAFLAFKVSANSETIGDTGWTVDQFIEWAYEVQPVKEHKRWKIRKEEGIEIRKLMEPNEPFHCQIINDANDVFWICRLSHTYKYEWDFKLPSPYKKLPEPVRKVIDSVNQEDVGKNIGEILPYAARPVAICASKEGKPVSSEAVEVRLLSLSDDKLEFTVETEPFILSDNPDFTGKIGSKVFLYVQDKSDINACKPEKQRTEK